MSRAEDPPKVFISYSWTSTGHQEWVIELATELRESGVDVILDRWRLKEGHDKFVFMETMVTDPNIKKVIIICDKAYTTKADDRTGGVGAETQIITPELYEKVSQDKFVVVVTERDEDGKPYVPNYYKSRIFIDFSDEVRRSENFEHLLRWIFGKPLHIEPPIGNVPRFISDGDSVVTMATSSRFRRASDAIRNGRNQASALALEYFETVSTEFENLRIQPEDGKELDDIVVQSLESFLPHRNQIIEMFLLLARFNPPDGISRSVHRFLEGLISYMGPSENTGSYHNWEFDNYRFIVHELYLYAVACFIRHERFTIAERLMSTGYYVPNKSGRYSSKLATFSVFGEATESLDYRNQRKELRRLSVRSDLLRSRSQGSGISFRDLMQADFVLFLRGQLDQERRFFWYPATLLFSCYEEIGLEIFMRSESARYFEEVKRLLGITDKDTLGNLLVEFDQHRAALPSWEYHTINPRALLGFDRIGSRP